jgi:restriction system protein
MARRNETILDVLAVLPWWVSVIVAGVVYYTLQYYFPSLETKSLLIQSLGKAGPTLAPWAALFFLLPAPVSLFNSIRKKRLLDKQKNIESIRSLSWKQFEELVGEAYRRQRYTVSENEGAGPDGGVDLWLKKDGNRYLVQCKQWKVQKIGVNVIREMYGLVTAHHAAGAIIITSGMFTQEAKSFANGKPLDLVEGQQLVEMIDTVRKNNLPREELRPSPNHVIQEKSLCPSCGAGMILGMAKKGGNAGQQFWGCSKYPGCKGTRTLTP